MTRLGFPITLLLIALASVACDQGRTPMPNVRVMVVHAAPSYGPLDFFRGRLGEAANNLTYRSAATQLEFNADQYDFHVNVAADNALGDELAAFTRTLVPDQAYRIVIAESGGAIVPLFFEQAALPTDSDSAEVTLVHAAETFAGVDAYVEPAGAALASATPLGTAAFRDGLAPVTRAPGDYRLFLTAVGDPATVLFESPTFPLARGQAELIVLTEGAGEGLAELVAVHANTAGATLSYDINEPAAVRIINAASDRAARDVYLDGDFTAAFMAGIAFGVPTPYETLSFGNHELNFTPAGNPSVVELESTQTFSIGRVHTVVVAGDSSALTAAASVENRRALRDTAALQIINGAGLFDNVEFYVAAPGTDIAALTPISVTSAPAIATFANVAPGSYELTAVDAATDTVLAGPVAVTLEASGYYSVLALDAVGGSTIEVQLLDDFN